jgi:selenoprotein W-related protein
VGLASELLKKFEPQIETLTLLPSDGGRFEVSVNGKLVYSKLQTGRHAEAGEIAGLVEKLLR